LLGAFVWTIPAGIAAVVVLPRMLASLAWARRRRDLDIRLHPGQHDPQLVRSDPLPMLPVLPHGRASRFSSSYFWRRLASNFPGVPLGLKHYSPPGTATFSSAK
jgi:hypothetical protein